MKWVAIPYSGDWAVCMTRSFATQPAAATHLVANSWNAPTPYTATGAVLVGPSPPSAVRQLAEGLLGSLDRPRPVGWE